VIEIQPYSSRVHSVYHRVRWKQIRMKQAMFLRKHLKELPRVSAGGYADGDEEFEKRAQLRTFTGRRRRRHGDKPGTAMNIYHGPHRGGSWNNE
jgi:hypothetical protein